MPAEDGFKRWKSTRRGVRESLGLKKRSSSKEHADKVVDSVAKLYFTDYGALSRTSHAERSLSKVRDRLFAGGFETFKDSDIKFALGYASGDPDLAFDFLDLLENSYAGKLEPYSPNVALKGAENNCAVTCYLDSVLFAIFGRLDDFEAMLYHTFEDQPRRRLVCLLRLWVNCLRTGKLVIAAFMAQLQSALAECGWDDAGSREQQDASEAFNFITDVLDLPRLTLKKDMFHQGKAEQDDHKYTNERTIDIGIPEAQEGKTITLEDCMVQYFDDRVVVERQRESFARRNTIGASPAPHPKQLEAESESHSKKLHVEVAELSGSNPATPTEPLPAYERRPGLTILDRTPSIFQDKKVEPQEGAVSPTRQNSLPYSANRKRSTTISKTVKMPAFQFFRLIPWYTEGNPNSDLQVAQHFETKRPTVGMCLKRFGQRKDGSFYKRIDKIDIPLETGIPEFLHDDDFSDERFPNHKFKLSLQSIICHRGATIQRGHYISYVRASRPDGIPPMDDSESPLASTTEQDPWLKFDDLGTPRVKYVDIRAELERECPYMLFYKIILRVDNDKPGRISIDGRPPSYTSESATSSLKLTNGSSQAADQDSIQAVNSLQQVTSGASSVISTTSGPPVAVPVQPGAVVHGAPQTVEPRPGSVADTEGTSIHRLEPLPDHIRARSVPEDAGAPPEANQPDMDEPYFADITKPGSRASITDKSGSGSGSIGRSLGSIFKPRASSKGRNSTSTRRTSLDLNSLAAASESRAGSLKTPPAIGEDAKNLATMTDGTSQDKLATRKSLDLGSAFNRMNMDGGRSGRKKDKETHKRERSLGERLKNDKSDRECILM